MADIYKLNNSRSVGRRNTYVDNTYDIISPSIKKQLQEINNDTNTEETSDQDESDSDYSSDNEGEYNHLNSNAYTYVPEEYQGNKSSDEEEERNERENRNSVNFAKDRERRVQDDSFNLNAKDPNQSKDQYLQTLKSNYEDDLIKVPTLELGKIKGHHQNNESSKLDSKTDRSYLNRVFLNLEKNLSDVRIEHQTNLSSSSLERSARKQDYRKEQTYSKTEKNEGNSSDVKNYRDNNWFKTFDPSKWEEELPEALRQFIDIESVPRETSLPSKNESVENTKDKKNKNLNNRNLYVDNIKGPIKKQASTFSDTLNQESSSSESSKEDYMDKIKKDYLEPIKDMFKEDFKVDLKKDLENIKEGIIDIYSKSPKILEDLKKKYEESKDFGLFGKDVVSEEEEKTEDTGSKDLDLYYMETNRNTQRDGRSKGDKKTDTVYPNLEKGAVLRDKKNVEEEKNKKCRVFNIYDKYENFDITDQPRLTHVPSFDINLMENNYNYKNEENEEEEEDNEDEEEKVVKSVGEYNIVFLSNLSRVNEKCQLLQNYQVKANLIKPWFLNPINEKMQSQATPGQKQGESEEVEKEEETVNRVIESENTNENIKYIFNRKNENVKYVIDDLPRVDPDTDKEANKGRKSNLREIENYYNETELDLNDSERNRFYDPISHLRDYNDRKKKSLNHTDWATFGRPVVKRVN